jgi:hypothetical protein
MSRIAKAAQIGATTCVLALLIAPAAFAAQVITHVPTPEIHVPPPQIHVPTPQTPDASTRLRQIEDSGGGGSGDARAKGPVDKRNPSAKSGSGEPASAIDYRIFAFGSLTYGAIQDGWYDSVYAADFAVYQAAITAAQQALDIAAECAVNPSLPVCASAESVPQAQQNLSDAQNALLGFYGNMNYLMWILAYLETKGHGDTDAETAAVEAAIEECLASPSTCDATIVQLYIVLEELGVEPIIINETASNGEMTLLEEQPSTVTEFCGSYPPPSPSSAPLSYYLGHWHVFFSSPYIL